MLALTLSVAALSIQATPDCAIDKEPSYKAQALQFDGVCVSEARQLIEPAMVAGARAFIDRVGIPDETLPAANGTVYRWTIGEMHVERDAPRATQDLSFGGGRIHQVGCTLAAAWDLNDQPAGWTISGHAAACERYLRWLR